MAKKTVIKKAEVKKPATKKAEGKKPATKKAEGKKTAAILKTIANDADKIRIGMLKLAKESADIISPFENAILTIANENANKNVVYREENISSIKGDKIIEEKKVIQKIVIGQYREC